FVDQGNVAFTNNLNGYPPQKQGFAARISIHSEVLADNRLLVQTERGATLGDATRPNYLIDQLNSLQFVSGGNPALNKGRFQLSGNLNEVINQTINFQGSTINAALTKSADRQLTLDTVVQQMDSEYGVDVNEEMARLTELQNSYAANAHVVSVIKQLLETLYQAV
ncbi:MAG TPA: flagellar basal body rod C-terminal domain-containing protein, partial [Devosia sp.]|nr:flagellar basal body rod C-terminal domain-containing protein [Devosia sp.]